MEQPLSKIKRLSKELPERDIKLAESFIAKRDFEKLLEIVVSDIYLVQQNNLSENPKEKYLNIDVDKLLELKVEIEEYVSLLDTTFDSDDIDGWMYG